MTKNEVFIIEPTAKVTYINKLTNEFWDNWKLYKDCDEKEKLKINLSSYPSNCILFDRDLKNFNEEQIDNDYKGFVQMLKKRKIDYFYSYRSPNGYHILAPFKDLENLEDNLRKELRKYYINLFLSDPAKISDKGVVSLPGKPHFKNGVVYDILENREGLNVFPENIIKVCKDNVTKQEEIKNKILSDKNFENYFEEDPFFLYVKTNIIPDGTNRDLTIFPNLAIAAVKSELDKKEIDDILKPVIKNNFPGKTYQEFEGWYKKAKAGQILDYNPIQINNWMREYSELKTDVYDTSGLDVKESLGIIDIKSEEFKVYWDEELDQIENCELEWLIDEWIPRGDICFIAGKAASFKTTICLHWAYALSNGKLVFNKYKVKPSRVLYLNEENSNSVILSTINRIKSGLDIKNVNNSIAFSLINNLRFDNIADINKMIKFINDNKIEVLFFDSFRRFFSGEENDATIINKIFNILKYIRSKTNTTMILIHHYKKSTGYSGDIRDRMRGSSDIMNSADTVLEISRRHGQSTFVIQHSKLRIAKEITDKLISIEEDENNSAYFYEIKNIEKEATVMNSQEKVAVQIANYLEANNIMDFSIKDIKDNIEAPYTTTFRALSILEKEGTIISSGKGKLTKYFYNKKEIIKEDTSKEKQDKLL